jgi:hypothetical protein
VLARLESAALPSTNRSTRIRPKLRSFGEIRHPWRYRSLSGRAASAHSGMTSTSRLLKDGSAQSLRVIDVKPAIGGYAHAPVPCVHDPFALRRVPFRASLLFAVSGPSTATGNAPRPPLSRAKR